MPIFLVFLVGYMTNLHDLHTKKQKMGLGTIHSLECSSPQDFIILKEGKKRVKKSLNPI